jgi:hypothetical protein
VTPVGFLDVLLGRSKPVKPDLDQLFRLPSAAITLEVSAGFRPTGIGAVCFRKAEGETFAQVETDAKALVEAGGGPKAEVSLDEYGFTWLIVRHDPSGIAELVTDLHSINRSLADAGFGPSLLCSLVGFRDSGGRSLGLVYLYKRGSFYPFAPRGGQGRDTALELQIKAQLADDLRIEPDLSRWFPVWGAPGL